MDEKIIEPKYVTCTNQLADLFTKPVRMAQVQFICSKLGMYDLHAPT